MPKKGFKVGRRDFEFCYSPLVLVLEIMGPLLLACFDAGVFLGMLLRCSSILFCQPRLLFFAAGGKRCCFCSLVSGPNLEFLTFVSGLHAANALIIDSNLLLQGMRDC